MQYRQFTISAYEREPGKWRARVRRSNGRSVLAGSGKLMEFVTAKDSPSEAEAMSLAIEAIDARASFRASKRSSEKFWRCTTDRENR
jgi:hypothetical protein